MPFFLSDLHDEPRYPYFKYPALAAQRGGVSSRSRMNADDIEQDNRDEATRLALTPRQVQLAVIAWLNDIASDPKVRKADRQLAHERAKSLQSLLFPNKDAKNNISLDEHQG